MKIKLLYAELHNALFLNGTNLQLKLDISKRQDLHLLYDKEEKELLVYYKGALAIIPSSNVSSMTPEDASICGAIPGTPKSKDIGKITHIGGPIKAQVSSPMSHVHEGPGAGK